MTTKILAFAGSLRAESWNKKLIRDAAIVLEEKGASVTVVDLRDYRMPLFDEDLEAAEGLPESARQFKRLMLSHDGFLIASPEYNSSLTAVLKNTLDWCSRKGPDDLAAWPFSHKVVGIVSASPGALGGLRGLVHLRAILSNVHALVLPTQLAVPKCHEVFDDHGKLKAGPLRDLLKELCHELVSITHKLRR